LPVLLGVLALAFCGPELQRSWWYRIFGPWLSVILSLGIALAIGWEGAICLVMAGIIYLPLASIGGVLTGWFFTWFKSRSLKSAALLFMLALPPTSAVVESTFALPVVYQGAQTEIVIHSTPQVVWQHIIRVTPIREPITGVFYRMGFPKPIAASL